MFSINLVRLALLLSPTALSTKTESAQFALKDSSFKIIPASDSLQNVYKPTSMDSVFHASKDSQLMEDFVYKTLFHRHATQLSSCQSIMSVLMATLFIAQNICLLQVNVHHVIPTTHSTIKINAFSLVLLTQ